MQVDLSNRQARLKQARLRFAEGESQLPADVVCPSVLRSWERSREAGISPGDLRLDGFHVSNEMREAALVGNRTLIARAKPEMELMWRHLCSPDWTILCTDQRGRIVERLDAGKRQAPEFSGLAVGRSLEESLMGTTAPLCALHEQSPAMITENQHFLSELDRFFCAAVPVMSPFGDVIATLDVTSINAQPQPWLMKQLRIARLSVENAYFLDLKGYEFFNLASDPRFLSTPIQGIVAVSTDERCVFANDSARNILALERGFGPLQNVEQRDAVMNALGDLRRKPRQSPPTPISVLGRVVYALAVPKQGKLPEVSSSSINVPRAEHSVFLGADNALTESFSVARKLFEGNVPILIQGETGVGKEVFASKLHAEVCPTGPLVAINCSAIPRDLIEAELFGYADGAFTGGRKGGAVGKIALAHGGTLFLDEIGDMPLELQSRLLRTLQARTISRIGDHTETPVDFRLISASHRHVETLVGQGAFREDLYYRINGVTVALPSLKDRHDKRDLVKHLLGKISPQAPKFLDAQSLQAVESYPWPGNIRQLEQSLRVAVILSGEEPVIGLHHFANDMRHKLQNGTAETHSGAASLHQQELQAVQRALKQACGNVSAAAAALGISRTTFYAKLKEANQALDS